MGSINYGNQTIQFNYYDPLNSDHFDQRNRDIIPVGIYKGGLIEIVSATLPYSINVLPLVVEISDGTQQVRVKTSDPANLNGFSAAKPYVTLQWSWQASVNNFMDMTMKSAGELVETDIIVGKLIYSGGVIDHIDYGDRTPPITLKDFLKVKAQDIPDLTVFVNPGWVSYGAERLAVAGTDLSGFTPVPVANPRIDLVWVDSGGAVQITKGNEGDPAPSHTGKIVLAEITLPVGATEITDDMITDCRPFVNLGGGGGVSGIGGAFLVMGA